MRRLPNAFALSIELSEVAEVPSSDVSGALTAREREVAHLVAQGLANKEIARQLGLSHGTVKLHVHSIFLKLNAQTPFLPGIRKRYVLIELMRSA